MYRPKYTKNNNSEIAIQLIQEYPLGLLIANQSGQMISGYLPFIVKKEDKKIILIGHMAKANPLVAVKEVHVYFQGPNRYISPTIFKSIKNVPTWNYAIVQVVGKLSIASKVDLKNILNDSTQFFEKRNKTNWVNELPERSIDEMLKYIVGFKIEIVQIIPKFKLSQNRIDQDYHEVYDFLSQSKLESDLEMQRWMRLSSKLN